MYERKLVAMIVWGGGLDFATWCREARELGGRLWHKDGRTEVWR
jgi:hypothetical protein